MLDHDLTVALLCRLNQNQSALGMALEEPGDLGEAP